MKRSVRVKIDVVVEFDDDGVGLPDISQPAPLLAGVVMVVAPSATAIAPGGRIAVGFTRETSAEIRRLRKAQAPQAASPDLGATGEPDRR